MLNIYFLWCPYTVEILLKSSYEKNAELLIFLSECLCNTEGSEGVACENDSGKCTCKPNVVGDKCDQCSAGFFGFPSCQGNFQWTVWFSQYSTIAWLLNKHNSKNKKSTFKKSRDYLKNSPLLFSWEYGMWWQSAAIAKLELFLTEWSCSYIV